MNMSLSTRGSSDGMDELSQAVDSAAEVGLVMVVAAGNAGPEGYAIGAPSAAERAITVCAMRDAGEAGWSLAPFSGRGPTADGRIKPDLCAPGVFITAPKAGTKEEYVTWNGTSMATPFVSGVAALLLEINPYLTGGQVKALLYETAEDWGLPGKDVDYGHGKVDAYRAIEKALGLSEAPARAGAVHKTVLGELEEGKEAWYTLEVTDTAWPIAATLLLTDLEGKYDLDMFLFNEGKQEIVNSMEFFRQETINWRPVKPGKYSLLIKAHRGSGPYVLDVTWR